MATLTIAPVEDGGGVVCVATLGCGQGMSNRKWKHYTHIAGNPWDGRPGHSYSSRCITLGHLFVFVRPWPFIITCLELHAPRFTRLDCCRITHSNDEGSWGIHLTQCGVNHDGEANLRSLLKMCCINYCELQPMKIIKLSARNKNNINSLGLWRFTFRPKATVSTIKVIQCIDNEL